LAITTGIRGQGSGIRNQGLLRIRSLSNYRERGCHPERPGTPATEAPKKPHFASWGERQVFVAGVGSEGSAAALAALAFSAGIFVESRAALKVSKATADPSSSSRSGSSG
jgi:hypothetical protein